MSVRHMLYGAAFLFLLVGASLGLDAYFTYRDLLKQPAFLPVSPQPPRTEPAAPRDHEIDYAVITRRNLFTSETLMSEGTGGVGKAGSGAPPQSPPPALQPRSAAPKPIEARFRLVGTTVFPGGGGYAILEDIGSKRQWVYRQGDAVQDVLIQEVRRGEIRVGVGGRFEVLRVFEKDEKEAAVASTKRPAAASVPGPPPGAARVLPRPQIARLVRSAEQMKSQFRAEPYQLPEGETGVRVVPLLAAGILRMLGIQAGDVVLAVDGNPVTSEEELHSALGQMLGKGEAEVAVLRGGQRLSLVFRIQ